MLTSSGPPHRSTLASVASMCVVCCCPADDTGGDHSAFEASGGGPNDDGGGGRGKGTLDALGEGGCWSRASGIGLAKVAKACDDSLRGCLMTQVQIRTIARSTKQADNRRREAAMREFNTVVIHSRSTGAIISVIHAWLVFAPSNSFTATFRVAACALNCM